MKINFYYIDINYIRFLKESERNAFKSSGLPSKTSIPNYEEYGPNSRPKCVCGVVLELSSENGSKIKYYVPLSSYKKQEKDNILIRPERNRTENIDGKKIKSKISETLGSLRFNYMFPVPDACVKAVDFYDRNIYSPQESDILKAEYDFVERCTIFGGSFKYHILCIYVESSLYLGTQSNILVLNN